MNPNKRRGTVNPVMWISILSLFLHVASCTPPAGDEGENDENDNYDLFYELKELEGSAGTILSINQGVTVGRNSWFEFEISNFQENKIITPGVHEGWCIEWTKQIAQQGDIHENVRMFSTYGKDRWKPLNYFLNIKDDLLLQDPDLTFREFQVVIWLVVHGPDFDLNKLSTNQLPARLRDNGEPIFDAEKAKNIAAKVKSEASSFIYSSGKTFAVLMDTGSDKQDVVVPVTPPADTVSHGFVEGVTPANIDPEMAERTYPVLQAGWEGPGGDKRWLGWNLGAVRAPASVDDDSPESAGWYFSFNFMNGFFPEAGNNQKVPDHIPGPVSGPQNPDLDSDWIEKDPCTLLLDDPWRVPAAEEWQAAADAGAASQLNLHYGGYILGNLSFLTERGTQGFYWSSTRHIGANRAILAEFSSESGFLVNINSPMLMWSGLPLRCIED
ncbi:MAG: hypothetical protein WEA56_08015 [Balneolaceae bacterium]